MSEQQNGMKIKYEQVPRLQPGSSESIAYLKEHGYVVIANVLESEQSETALAGLWDYLEGLETGIDRSDNQTWGNDKWPTAVHGGILPSYGIGHCQAQWFIRDIPKVKKSFAAIWDTDDLLVSFDGVSLWRPWCFDPVWKTNLGSSWFHIDQHPIGRTGLQCVQGLVNLLPTSESTGGNVIVPGSHLLFPEIPELYTERLARIDPSIDHFRFPKDDPLILEKGPITCHMEAGDLLLWDSRTVHCSNPGSGTGLSANELIRAVSLICMMPRSRSNQEVISRRKQAVSKRISTTNWSDRFINADQFPQITSAENAERFVWPAVPELSNSQLKLVGWTDDELAVRP
ncbi:MAG: hypothetical protein HOL98_04895 [Gammaproteobacteria bacterium]|jgi:hypothetical protein|nr:hypothetical protein [Gammaproteobacteria bacterium]MBT5202774.1 hypothetical protein [Gammaproteobacteria bacterium]MBT6243878.1 hypothetical protein [Gammaproteobacteria bacterium]